MNTRFTKHCLLLIISTILLLPSMNSHAGETTRVSVDSAGQQANSSSSYPTSISADGRFVTFNSAASNLVEGDTNATTDVFVHDRITGITTRVSVDSTGLQGNSSSFSSVISADGHFVAFVSEASNLVAGDTNSTYDIFVHDLTTGITTRVNVDSAGQQGNRWSWNPAISADGRWVAFYSGASNLVTGDTNGVDDVFVHNRSTGETTRVSIDSAGNQGNDRSSPYPSISADGRFVAFESYATNLVPGDTNGFIDTFVHDRITGATTRVSVDSADLQGDSVSYAPSISSDGRMVTFTSSATNLVADDTNGVFDIFVRDRAAGTTTRVSIDSAGLQGDSYSWASVISGDGRFVLFRSAASNLVAEDTNAEWDFFVYDRITGTTTRVNVNSAGQQANGDSHIFSYGATISADGRFVAFYSESSNLVKGDSNRVNDVFVRDRQLVRHKTADLQVAVTSLPASVQTGQTAGSTYTLTNNGPDNINSEVKLTDVIANGSVLSLTPSQGSCKKAAVSVCRFGALASGASVTLTAEIKAGSDPLTQQLSVNAPPVDNVPDNNSVSVSTPVTP